MVNCFLFKIFYYDERGAREQEYLVHGVRVDVVSKIKYCVVKSRICTSEATMILRRLCRGDLYL